MERLTKRDTDGQAMMDCEKCKADWTGKHGKPMADCTALYCRNRLKDRLAAYEDTELTPEEIKSMQEEHFSGLEMAKLHSVLMELKKYQEADKDGRIVVLPCKVGDTVWVILDGAKCVRRCVVEYATIGRYFTVIVFHTADRTREQYGVPAGAFGKTVFLTSEEAEKALEAMKDG